MKGKCVIYNYTLMVDQFANKQFQLVKLYMDTIFIKVKIIFRH